VGVKMLDMKAVNKVLKPCRGAKTLIESGKQGVETLSEC